jgi:hypothetical protein
MATHRYALGVPPAVMDRPRYAQPKTPERSLCSPSGGRPNRRGFARSGLPRGRLMALRGLVKRHPAAYKACRAVRLEVGWPH